MIIEAVMKCRMKKKINRMRKKNKNLIWMILTREICLKLLMS